MSQRTDNDVFCDVIGIEDAYTAKMMDQKLCDIDASSILDMNKGIIHSFLTEIHARIITIQHDLELRSSKITIKIMRGEINNLKELEQNIYDGFPEYFL